MSYAYSNNGFSFRAVDSGFELDPGEIVFPDLATSAELLAAFPGYLSRDGSGQWVAYRALAQAALSESDKTVLRCYESGAAVPAPWVAYRKALRAIVGAASGDSTVPLPTRPDYPAGT